METCIECKTTFKPYYRPISCYWCDQGILLTTDGKHEWCTICDGTGSQIYFETEFCCADCAIDNIFKGEL